MFTPLKFNKNFSNQIMSFIRGCLTSYPEIPTISNEGRVYLVGGGYDRLMLAVFLGRAWILDATGTGEE
jgi:hypothetical protein